MPSALPTGSPRPPPGSPGLGGAGGGGRRRCWPRQQQKGCAAHFRRNCARSGEGRATRTNLPLLELLPCQEAPARRLEEGDVPAGLRVPLLLQPGQRSGPEKNLREGSGVRCRWVPASLPPRRATLPPRRLVGMWLSPPQPLVLSRRGGFIPQAQGMLWVEANSAALVLPRRTAPSRATQPCPRRHRRPQPVSGIVPGSSPCGSCSSRGPVTPGAPPPPAGRERCQGWAGSTLGCRGPLGCRGCQTAALAPARCTYPFLVHHDVVAPVLLGQVRGQDVKAPPELRKHHVVGVPWGEQGRAGLWGSQDARGMATGSPVCPDWLGPIFWDS